MRPLLAIDVSTKLARDELSTAVGERSQMTDPLAINPEPAGRFSFQQMIPTLVFDVAMPIVAFNVLTRYGVATLWALVAGGLFPSVHNLRVWPRSRGL